MPSTTNPYVTADYLLTAVGKTVVYRENRPLLIRMLDEMFSDACHPRKAEDWSVTDFSYQGHPDFRNAIKCHHFNVSNHNMSNWF